MVQVAFDELDGQYPPSEFDWVGITRPDRWNEHGEAVWVRPSIAASMDLGESMPGMRRLTVVTTRPRDVPGRLTALGYDADGFVEV